MKRPSYPLTVTVAGVAAVLALSGIGTAPVQAAVTAPVDCPRPFPTAQAVDGVQGTGFTVERGTTPEPFSAEVMGRIDNGIAPGVDMIMARVSSPAITRAGGIWAGMSGSPVYAPDGRLIGAVAYGLASNTVYAGITPAESMAPLLTGGSAPRAAAPRSGPSRIAVPPAAARQLAARGVGARAAEGGFRRLPLPVSLSGAGDAYQRRITARMVGSLPDVRVVTGGSRAPATAAPASTIRAGGNFVAALSYGATTSAAVGTTTFVCNGRAVAFGHPLLFAGPRTFSAHSATALFVQPNTAGPPFKVANIGGVAGTVDREARTGIGARLGAGPRSAVVTTTLRPVGGRAATQTTRVPTDDYASTITALQVLRGAKEAAGGKVEGSATMAVRIAGTRANGRPFTLALSDRHADVANIGFELALRLSYAVGALEEQEFENVRITSVDVKGAVEPTVREYRITGVTARKGSRYVPLEQADLTPGSTVRVRVAMASYKNLVGRRTVDVALKVPRSLPRDGVLLEIDAGSVYSKLDYEATSFGALLKELQTTNHGTTVRLSLITDDGTGRASGRRVVASAKASVPATIRPYQWPADPFAG